MAVAQKGAISFGLVYIPVELYTATQDNDIRFNQLSRKDNSRIKYKKVSGATGEEVRSEDIVKGYQYDKDKYVVVTDEDFEKIKTEKDRSIQILQFTDMCTIPPVYFNRSYYAVSQKGGEKAFELLRAAMLQEKKIAIGKTVIGSSETMLSLIPTGRGMLVETLYFHDEIRNMPAEQSHPKLADAELNMATQLIGTMAGEFQPELYHDEYQEKLRDMIARKIEGQEIVAPMEKPQGKVINLMEALKQSLEQQKKTAPAEAEEEPATERKRTRRKAS